MHVNDSNKKPLQKIDNSQNQYLKVENFATTKSIKFITYIHILKFSISRTRIIYF